MLFQFLKTMVISFFPFLGLLEPFFQTQTQGISSFVKGTPLEEKSFSNATFVNTWLSSSPMLSDM